MLAGRFRPKVRAVLRAFHGHEVRALLVGGHAVAVHGYERPAVDVDLWIALDGDNAIRIWHALGGLGLDGGDIGELEVLTRDGPDLGVGEPWIGLDLCKHMGSLDFDACWERRAQQIFDEPGGDGLIVPVLGWEDLLAIKRELGRPKDLRDLAGLSAAE